MADGIRIDALSPTVLQSRLHELAVMKDGQTVKLTVAQILALLQTGDLSDGLVTTPILANNAVTYAKMQDLSTTARVIGRKSAGAGDPQELTLSDVLDMVGSAAEGDILFRGAAGWVRLPKGAARQVLRQNAGLTAPAWEESDVKFLTGGNFSGAQNDIVLTSYIAAGYSRFRLHWREWLPATNGSQLLLQMSSNGGSSFLSSGYAGQALFAQGSNPTVASAAGNSTTSAFSVVMGTTNGASGFATGHVEIDILATFSAVQSCTHTVTTTPSHAVYIFTGFVAVTGANAIRLSPSGGNHNGGTYSLYGLRNS